MILLSFGPHTTIEYQKEKKASKNNTPKSLRFHANIPVGDHGLERKVADMVKFLEEGRDCDFSVFSKCATMRLDDHKQECNWSTRSELSWPMSPM